MITSSFPTTSLSADIIFRLSRFLSSRASGFRAVFSLSFLLPSFRASFLHSHHHRPLSSSCQSSSDFLLFQILSICRRAPSLLVVVPFSSTRRYIVASSLKQRLGSIIRDFLIVDIHLFLIEPFRCRLIDFFEFELALLIVRVTQACKTHSLRTALSFALLSPVTSRVFESSSAFCTSYSAAQNFANRIASFQLNFGRIFLDSSNFLRCLITVLLLRALSSHRHRRQLLGHQATRMGIMDKRILTCPRHLFLQLSSRKTPIRSRLR
jgi:hypothetical protein